MSLLTPIDSGQVNRDDSLHDVMALSNILPISSTTTSFSRSSLSSSPCCFAKPWSLTIKTLRKNPISLPHSKPAQTETVQGQAMEEKSSKSVARRLILLRHADSSWQDRSLRDHDRPLSKAGQADAISISHKLQQLGWIPDLILSSDAVRTRETLKIMQEQVQSFSEAEVHFISSFYSVAAMDGQTAEHLQQVTCKYTRDEILTVMCMGHNRGWEEAASMFSGASVELKTCNAALLEANGKSWQEAFSLAGLGGWKLCGVLKPDASL